MRQPNEFGVSIPIVASLADGIEFRDFFRRRLETLAPPADENLEPRPFEDADVDAWARVWEETLGALRQSPLPTRACREALEDLSEPQRAEVSHQLEALQEAAARHYPAAEGERIEGEEMAYLAEPWEGFEERTLVYVQRTTNGTLAVLLLEQRLGDGRESRSASERRALAAGLPSSCAKPPDSSDATKLGNALFILGSAAASLLPTPWGKLAPAGISVLKMFVGGDSSDGMTKALDAATQSIENAIRQQDITDQLGIVKAATRWLQVKQQVVKDIGDGPDADKTVAEMLRAINEDIDSPTSPLSAAIQTLDERVNRTDDRGFDALLAGVGIYLTYLRVRLQLQAWQAARQKHGTHLRMSWFDEFRIETEHWIPTVGQYIQENRNDRLARVGKLRRGVRDKARIAAACAGTGLPGYLACQLARIQESYWGFPDAASGKTCMQFDTAKPWPGSVVTLDYKDVQHKTEATRMRNGYVAEVNQALDKKYGPANEGVGAWQSHLDEWKKNLTPRAPDSGPVIAKAPRQWGGPLPEGSTVWARGNVISYAVAFTNGSGTSAPGPWSEPATIEKLAFPTILEIPVDPIGLATSRGVWRKVTFADGRAPLVGQVGVLPDNTTDEFQDRDDP